MDSMNTNDELKSRLEKCHRLIEEAKNIRAAQMLNVSDNIELEKEVSASI